MSFLTNDNMECRLEWAHVVSQIWCTMIFDYGTMTPFCIKNDIWHTHGAKSCLVQSTARDVGFFEIIISSVIALGNNKVLFERSFNTFI